MDVQAAPPTYTPASGVRPPSGNPPVLGQQVPGMAGGLPSQGGLSVLNNPLSQQLQSQGRGEDTMLVHMTPNEVNSLQGLAMAHGGSLTINPNTGLPEAGILGKILPTVLGALGTFVGIPPWVTAAAVGGVTGAVEGDVGKGLMAGLGAFGGASLAGGIQGAIGGATVPGAASTASPGLQGITAGQLGSAGNFAASNAANTVKTGLAGFAQGFGNVAKGLPVAGATAPATGLMAKAAVPLAVTGALQPFNSTSGFKTQDGRIDNSYQGPYTAQKRPASFAPATGDILSSSKERDYFAVDVPEIYNVRGDVVQAGSQTAPGTPIMQSVLNPNAKKNQPMYSYRSTPYMQPQTAAAPQASGFDMIVDRLRASPRPLPAIYQQLLGREYAESQPYAKGGEVELADGAFVVDARTVSELGNGSSNAGHELLARMGGRPVRGPGDGVSDSIPARIGRDQPARVARDEVVFSPEAVKRVGNGSEKRGAQKLYALMDKAHKARRKSERGKDTGLRKGLA